MAKVYKLKHKVKVEDLSDLGYTQIPGEIVGNDIIVYKGIEIDMNSDLITALISIYNNEEWQKIFAYDEDSRQFYKDACGIEFESVFDESGLEKICVVDDGTLREKLSRNAWRIECNMADKQIYVTAGIRDELPAFYNKDILDKYVKEEIEKLFEQGYLTIINVKE